MEFIIGRSANMLQASPCAYPRRWAPTPRRWCRCAATQGSRARSETGRRADTMLFGVGAASTSTTLFEGSFLDVRMLDELVALGAVGEIGGRFFDADGAPGRHRAGSSRAVSVPLEDIRGRREDDPGVQRSRQVRGDARRACGAVLARAHWSAISIVPVGYWINERASDVM